MVRTELSGKRTATGTTQETLKAKTMKRNLHYLNLQPADRLVVPKSTARLVQHHAIYLGIDENGIELIAEKIVGTGVRIVSASDFLMNAIEVTRIERFSGTVSERQRAIEYALALVGTNYDLLQFNCEHYANCVQHNRKESNQVKAGLALGVAGLLAGILLKND